MKKRVENLKEYKSSPLPRVLAIVTARSGSKRLPGKNTQLLCGKPLVGWTVEQASRCSLISQLIISTNCENIAKIAESFGASVPFIRPAALAKDDSTSNDVIEHALNFFACQHEHFDMVILLEPTSPLRKKEDIERSLELLIQHESTSDALIAVGEVVREHPADMQKIVAQQYLTPYLAQASKVSAFYPYGGIYISKVSSFRQFKTFYQARCIPYYVERWQSFEIDDGVDFLCVEKMMEKYADAMGIASCGVQHEIVS